MTAFTNSRGYAIGEMSKRTGVNIETIRYYERIGILPEPGRTSGGNRQYDDEHLKRLSFIRRCRELGFSMKEIRTLLMMVDERDLTCAEVHNMTIAHMSDIQTKIADLRKLETALKAMAAKCSQGDIPECPIIEALFEIG